MMMSKNIHKWTDGRYTLMFDEHTFFVWDNENNERMTALNVTKRLNEQQSTIQSLKEDKAIAEDYANIFEKENVKLRKQIDEQQATIQELERKVKKYAKIGEEQLKQIIELQEENEQLKKRNKFLEEFDGRAKAVANLKEENEKLKERRDYWSKKTKEFIYYFNCLEKAIEKTFDSDDQCFEEIWKHYDEMEKKWEYNDSFVGNWTDKPVLLERKMGNINENRDKQRLLAKQGKGISRRE